LTEEKASVSFQDSAIIGDVTVTQNNAECPSCSASNVRVMKCHEVNCEKRFCELCHPKCRYLEGSFLRFDSGEGLGSFCKGCGTIKFTAWKIIQERLRSEREAIERQEILTRRLSVKQRQERLAKEAKEIIRKRELELIEKERIRKDEENTIGILLEVEKFAKKRILHSVIISFLIYSISMVLFPEEMESETGLIFIITSVLFSISCCFYPFYIILTMSPD